MQPECSTFSVELLELAEGHSRPVAEAHLADCAACTEELSRLRQLISALRFPMLEVPPAQSARLPRMAAHEKRTIWARLLNQRPALSSRSQVEDPQLLVGDEEISIRLRYVRSEDSIRVLGRLPEGFEPAEVDFVAADESQTGFVVESPTLKVAVPSLRELLDESERPD